MDILYLLVPLSVLAMLAILGLFAWALRAGQFEEVDVAGAQILAASDAGARTEVDADQVLPTGATEQSFHVSRQPHRSSP